MAKTTQGKLANKCGVSLKTISLWCNDEIEPKRMQKDAIENI